MRFMKHSTRLILIISLAIIGSACSDYGPPAAGQVKSVSWEATDEIGSKDAWTTFAPPLLIQTTEVGQLVVMFNTECAGASQIIRDSNGAQTDLWGIPILVRIKINDVVASPSESFLTSSPFVEMKTFVATAMDLPAGAYTISVEVKSTSEKGWLRNRTLTVWESVRGVKN